jgi:hypothetical protein
MYSVVNFDLPMSSSPASCDPPAGSDSSVKYVHIPSEQNQAGGSAPPNSSSGATRGRSDPKR